MKVGLVLLYALVILSVTVTLGSSSSKRSELNRNKRTIQYIVNHFAQFFGLSVPTKAAEKQDSAANPLRHLFMGSSAKLSGGSGATKSTTPKPFSLQYEIPSKPERLIQNEAQAVGPSKLPLLETTTTTEAFTVAVEAELASPAPETAAPSEEPVTEPIEPSPTTTIEPILPEPDQTTLSSPTEDSLTVTDTAENRGDNVTDSNEGSPQTPAGFVGQQVIQRPVWNPFASQAFGQLPFTSYFGNNVFLQSPFLPQHHLNPYAYQQYRPAAANLIGPISPSVATSHSRVKMHDQPYDLVTYHGDSVSAPSSYQMQVFGKRVLRQY